MIHSTNQDGHASRPFLLEEVVCSVADVRVGTANAYVFQNKKRQIMKSLANTIVDEILGRPREDVDEIFENEPVIWKGPANHLSGLEFRGGWLRLTPTRLAFRSHGLNVQNREVNLARTDIVSAKISRIFGLFKGVEVTLKIGKPQKFVVWDREGLVEAIYT